MKWSNTSVQFAVVDLSLHEITDHFFDGDYDAGADRGKAALSASDEEMAFLGKHLAQLCNDAKGDYRLLVPMGGFSAFDSEGGPLWNPEGRRVFVDHLTKNISGSQVKTLDYHINDPEFAQAILENIRELTAG